MGIMGIMGDMGDMGIMGDMGRNTTHLSPLTTHSPPFGRGWGWAGLLFNSHLRGTVAVFAERRVLIGILLELVG